MTSLSQALIKAGAEAIDDRREATAPVAASDEAVRLALALRETRGTAGIGRLLLFVPAAEAADAAMVTGEAVAGLLELHDGPVLVIDLRGPEESPRVPAWLAALPDDEHVWGGVAGHGAAIANPFSGRRDRVPYAASPDFAAFIADARARYPFVIFIGGHVPASVETLMIASSVDGVVLSVPPDRTTRPEMQRVVERLRRTHAPLVGFVVDARDPGKESPL